MSELRTGEARDHRASKRLSTREYMTPTRNSVASQRHSAPILNRYG